MLDHGADGVVVRDHRGGGPELGHPAPPADRRRARGRRLRQDRLRRAGARLPLRHDPHVRARRRAAQTGSARSTTWWPPRSGPAGDALAPGVVAARTSTPHRGRSSRRRVADALPARARPRCRTGDPRGAGNQCVGRRYTASLALPSPWSPVSICPAAAVSASRTPWSWAARVHHTRIAYPVPQGTGRPLTPEKNCRGIDRTTSRTASCSTSTASSGPSSSSSTSSPARAARSCAPSSRTCCPARSSTRRSTPASRSRWPTSTAATARTSTATARDFVFMDSDRLRPASTCPRPSSATRRTSCSRTRPVRSPCTRARRCTSSCPPSVELDDHLHRAGPAGRPLDRRHQARHRRDRRRDPGAAVHQDRRQGQGRHPRRRLPRPR